MRRAPISFLVLLIAAAVAACGSEPDDSVPTTSSSDVRPVSDVVVRELEGSPAPLSDGWDLYLEDPDGRWVVLHRTSETLDECFAFRTATTGNQPAELTQPPWPVLPDDPLFVEAEEIASCLPDDDRNGNPIIGLTSGEVGMSAFELGLTAPGTRLSRLATNIPVTAVSRGSVFVLESDNGADGQLSAFVLATVDGDSLLCDQTVPVRYLNELMCLAHSQATLPPAPPP